MARRFDSLREPSTGSYTIVGLDCDFNNFVYRNGNTRLISYIRAACTNDTNFQAGLIYHNASNGNAGVLATRGVQLDNLPEDMATLGLNKSNAAKLALSGFASGGLALSGSLTDIELLRTAGPFAALLPMAYCVYRVIHSAGHSDLYYRDEVNGTEVDVVITKNIEMLGKISDDNRRGKSHHLEQIRRNMHLSPEEWALIHRAAHTLAEL